MASTFKLKHYALDGRITLRVALTRKRNAEDGGPKGPPIGRCDESQLRIRPAQ